MELQPKRITDAASFEGFRNLLQSSGLPHQDLDFQRHILMGYHDNDELVGTGALEIYGENALLRSLAVKIGARGLSLGSSIIKDLIRQGKKNNLKGIYLLTETAASFFALKGFKEISRDLVPDDVRRSSEFSHVCPASATCMFLECV